MVERFEEREERERVNDEHPQERVNISVQKIWKQCRKIPNWKVPGRGGVQGYWIKDFYTNVFPHK